MRYGSERRAGPDPRRSLHFAPSARARGGLEFSEGLLPASSPRRTMSHFGMNLL
jgi:hypothetical protein